MKSYWMAVVIAGGLVLNAAAQTNASGAAGANASVSAGQSGANASASQNTQANTGTQNSNAQHQGNATATTNSNANAGMPAGGASVGNATIVRAELTKSLDAKKAKPGDEVTARVTEDVKSNGQVVIRKGAKLIGHVTEAQARTKENSESKLGIAFDKAVVKSGSEVAFNAIVQAVGPGERISAPAIDNDNSRMNGSPAPMGGGPVGGMGGVTSTAGSAVNSTLGGANSTVGQVGNTAGGAINTTAGAAANGTLTTASRGVIGMEGLALTSAASGSAGSQSSILSSTSRTVKLDSGTQMVLQVSGAIQQ